MISRYVEAFLLQRESEGKSLTTLANHSNNLREFTKWTEEQAPDPQAWTPTTIRAFVVYLQQRGTSQDGDANVGKSSRRVLKPSSVRCYVNSVLAFVRWLHQEELIPRDIATRVVPPKIPTLVQQPFEVADVKRLLAAAKANARTGLRDYAMLLFLLDTGARVSEVIHIRPRDILWGQRCVKVFGKGGKERVLFCSPETMRAMQKYALRAGEHETFFTTEEGNPLTGSGLTQLVRRIGKRARIDDCHPHRFRHTFAISFLRSGGNVLALQRLLGHTTLAMTQRYVALVADDLQREHVAHSPVSFMLK